ncbi:hypothetical protein MRX96_024818 [Rhipicephalus microplus]
MQRPLGAAEFVQSVVSMNMAQSDLEKVSWYGSLARLYLELGLGRKAAFYTRVAALKCMAGKPDPFQCYQLLLKSLPGYRLSLDKPTKGRMEGWPRLQIQLLQDMLVTARKMDDLPLAVGHVCQLLEWLVEWLSPAERSEACQQLQTLASRLQGPASAWPPTAAPAPGSTVPATGSGPTPAAAAAGLHTVSVGGRCASGELPSVPGAAAGVEPIPCQTAGHAQRAIGQLQLRGYSTCVLGVHSECVLAQPPAPVTVVPPLPLLEVMANLPLAPDFATIGDSAHVVNNYALSLYAGEQRQCVLTLNNCGAEPIEMLELSLQTKLDRESEHSLIRWSPEKLQSQLPVDPGGAASLTLQVHGQAPFLHSRELV